MAVAKRLYTIKEAARYLGHSVYGLRTLIWDGELPVIQRAGPGGKLYLDVADLDRWIERQKITAIPLPRKQ
jgi:excisionase family DNA binding protein